MSLFTKTKITKTDFVSTGNARGRIDSLHVFFPGQAYLTYKKLKGLLKG